MNLRVTAAVLVLLVVLAGVVVGLDRFKVGQSSSSTTSASQDDQTLQIFKFDDHTVNALTVRSGDTTVRFERSGDSDWTIAGSNDPPNKVSVTSLLIRMSDLKGTKRVDDPGADLKQFGLDQPKKEVTAELADGTTATLQMGDNTPTASGTYARKADATDVYIISTQFATDVQTLAANPKEPPTPTPRPSPTTTPTAAATPSPTP